jgi:pyridoxal phosphate enzyme (YggS family)
MTTQPDDERLADLATNLAEVRERIATAARSVGRRAEDVTLVAVSKTWPAHDVRLLFGLGVGAFGENRDQEAQPKARAVADLPLQWHFIGQLQSNKARSVATYTDVVESVDRAKLVTALQRGAEAADRVLTCLIQVDLDPDAGTGDKPRGGALPGEIAGLAEAITANDRLRLRGLMAVAPLDADPDEAFGRLAALAEQLRATYPQATIMSAGMTADLEAAIRAGATHVRVGSAVFGRRPPVR